MSTYTRQLAKRIREQNEIRDIYKERQQEAQTSYDTAVNTLKSGGDVYSLDDSARAMYRNIQAELARQSKEEQERLKKEREQMSGIERFGHTLGDFFGQGVGGLMKFGENFVDYFGTMFGADEDWVKRDWTQELYMDKLREGTKGSFLNDGKFGNMVQSSMFGLGNMLPSLALNAVPYVGGALSTASFMVNAAGGSTERALQEGATRGNALLYGTLSGISEGAIEKISGGIGGVGKGIVQSVGKNAGKSAVAKGVLGTAKKYTGRMIGEGLEEVASDVIDPLLRATYTGNVDYSDMTAGSLAETFGVGAMTSGLMLGGQAMAHNATAANRVRTKLGELNEVKATLDKRYYDGKLTEAQYKQGLSDINWLAEKTIKTMNRVSDRKAEKIVDKVGEKRLENAGIIQDAGKFSVNSANAGAYNYKAMTPSLANKLDSLAYQPTSAELTAEQESLVKDYGKINNGKASIVFTDDIGAVTEDGSKLSANGAYSDGVIYISRTAENPLREVMKHEFTHALEGSKAYGKFADFVIGEIQKSPVLQKEYGDFAKTFIETAEQYKGVTAGDRAIVSEIVAKYSERLFSDPKAINRLARANKGLAMKVLGMVTDRLSALGKGKGTAEMRKFLRRAEGLYRRAISAKPSRGIALNGNTANEKDTTADTTENSNIENTANITDSTENRTNIETNSQNIDENNNILDGNAMSIRTVSDSSGKKVQYSIGKPFGEQIDEVINGKHDPNLDIYVSQTPDVLINIGFKDKAILMRNSKVKEILEKHKEMSLDIIKNIPNAIENPLLILKSKTNPNDSVVIITEINTEKGNLIIPVWMNVEGKYYDIELNKVLEGEYNFIASAYGRNIKTLLEYATNNNEILYFDKSQLKKVNQLFSAHGLQLPAPLNMTNFNNSISNSETNVNNSVTESLKNQEKAPNIDENSNILRNKQSNIKFSLAEDSNGVKYVKIDTEQNIFDGIAYENLGKVAKTYLREHFRGVEIDSIKINNTSVDEYTMSRNTQRLYSSEREAYTTKMKAATELDNFIKAGIYNRREVAKHPKTFNKDGYEIYDINFEIDDKKFSGEMLIAINGDKKLFYDITKIKKKMSPAIQVFPKGGGTSSSNNSISNSKTNVNNSATESLKNDENSANINENSNSDIKFSLKKPIEYKKNLVAIHNLSESKLLDSLSLGGFAMPSIAVLKADGDHNSFGDISVVFRPSAVDPKANADNKIYSADAYTPRFPQTEYSYNRQAMRDLADKLNTSVSMLEANEFKSSNLDDIYRKLERNNEVKKVFVSEKGLKVVPVLHDPEFSRSLFNNDAIKEFLASGISFKDLVYNESIRNKLLNLIVNKSALKSFAQKQADKINDELNDAKNDKSIYEELEIKYNKDIDIAQNKTEKVETPYSYSEGLSNLIEEHSEEYSAFVKALVDPIIDKKWLRNNKEYYTPSGNPRSFKQLHDEYTADNALRLMKELGMKNTEGGEFGYGLGELKAALSKTYDSIEAVHKDEARLKKIVDDELSVLYEKCEVKLIEICDKIAELINHDNIYIANQIASNAVYDIVRTKSDAQAKAIIKRDYSFELTDEILSEVRELAREIAQLPVEYFEAKPARVVNFDEIAAIVAPSNVSSEVKSAVARNGIEMVSYDKSNASSRVNAVNSIKDVKFSLKANKAQLSENITLTTEQIESVDKNLLFCSLKKAMKRERNIFSLILSST